MQYKTVTVEHPQKQKKNAAEQLNAEYEQIINKQAMEGWKLLGIHPVPIRRKTGCMKVIMSGIIIGYWTPFQADVLVFFKDDGTDQYTGPIYTEEQKNSNESLKQAGAAVAGITKNAVNFIKSEETANKLSGLKNMAKSRLSGLSNNEDDADSPEN